MKIADVEAQLIVAKEEVGRLQGLLKWLRNPPLKQEVQLDLFDSLPVPKQPRVPVRHVTTTESYTGIRAHDLPDVLTEADFHAYLDIKREEKPGDKFFANEQGVRDWLKAKGKTIA